MTTSAAPNEVSANEAVPTPKRFAIIKGNGMKENDPNEFIDAINATSGGKGTWSNAASHEAKRYGALELYEQPKPGSLPVVMEADYIEAKRELTATQSHNTALTKRVEEFEGKLAHIQDVVDGKDFAITPLEVQIEEQRQALEDRKRPSSLAQSIAVARGDHAELYDEALKQRDALRTQLAQAQNEALAYKELLFAVARKFPGETRHQTALRYITEAEYEISGTACSEIKPTDGKGE